MVLAFIPEATDGVDRAMDALSSSDEMPADVYFVSTTMSILSMQ
jgi:hypothetical protein